MSIKNKIKREKEKSLPKLTIFEKWLLNKGFGKDLIPVESISIPTMYIPIVLIHLIQSGTRHNWSIEAFIPPIGML